MEIAASVATELALSGLSRVINKLASNFGGDVTADEMEHLKVFVGYEIEALIREATSDDLKQWKPLLKKLQAAALELEDLLDVYEYNQIEKQVSSFSSSNHIKNKFKEKLGPILPKSSLRIGLEKLLKFVGEVEKIHPFIMSRKVTTQPLAKTVTPKTSTLSSPFYGRGDQCDTIIKLLLDESHADLNSRTKNVPIITIRGLGGAGKTTTAQHVYNDKIIENYFDLRMWVHVTRGFDERRLIKETIESAEVDCGQTSRLEALQKKLKKSVSNKKFLLVLDDVWEEDTTRLDILLGPLNQVGVKGSKIIVTTRTKKAAKDLNAKTIILLDELKDEDCWSILKHYAFNDNEEIIEDHQELEYVGNQIISEVKHSPLALKVVGSSLRNKRSSNEWENFLQQDMLKETMDLLLFSYQCLPLHLQRCFAYCSLFSKGYKFYFDVCARQPHLISLWIAQGFIETTSVLTFEEAGQKYIEELLSYSFFEKKFDDCIGDHFVIHDLLHDLVEKVSKNQCHRIEHHDSLDVPTTCIHLSLCITENLVSADQSTILAISDMFNLRNLRSLIILSHVGSMNIFKYKKDILQNLTKLCALYVESSKQMEVLSDAHKLKHLRYLNVRYDRKLPTSLTKLYHLQFFSLTTNLGDRWKLLANILPQGFSNLINLRTLQFYSESGGELDYLYYNSEMVNIEKLPLLQNLKKFHVDGFNGMISLRNLPLGGSLSILNLENVKCKEDAEKAMLNKKRNLNELIFKWSDTPSTIDACEEVLEGLKPHRNLEKLEIVGYQGVKFPKWMVQENWSPRLQTLKLWYCTSLKMVSFLPPRLQELDVYDCSELMQLPPFSGTLLILKLINCPKLQALANLNATVTDLTIVDCPNLTPSIFNKSSSLSDMLLLTNIEHLYLRGLPNLQALTNLSPTIKIFTINDCPKLTSLGNLQRCTSLQRLMIFKCPMLKREKASLVEGVVEGDIVNRLAQVEHISTDEPSLVLELVQLQAFSSIKQLFLRDCAVLPNLKKFLCLKDLEIKDCPNVESLPNLPISLQSLWIYGCPKLKEKYKEGGPLRNTIPDITQIDIY